MTPEATVEEPGARAYVVALVTGLPVAALMLVFAMRSVTNGDVPDPIVFLLGVPAAVGSALAVVGMRSRPRRFRTAARWLTLLPFLACLAIGLFLAFIIAMFVAGGNAS